METITYRPGTCETLSEPDDLEDVVKQAIRKWYLNDNLKKYEPAFIYIHSAQFIQVAEINAVITDSALTLPIRIDDTGQLTPGKVRICTDVEITEEF